MPWARATRGLRSRTGSPPIVTARCRRGRRRTAGGPARCGPIRAGRPGRRPRRGCTLRSNGATQPLRPSPVAAQERRLGLDAGGVACASSFEGLERRRALADHLRRPARAGAARGRVLADEPAVAQHGDAVGDLVDLVEEVGDEHHRDARRPQLARRPRTARRPRWASRLDVGSSRISTCGVDLDGPGDRHELLHGDRVRTRAATPGRCRGGAARAPRWCAGASPPVDAAEAGAARARASMFSATERLAARLTSWYTVLIRPPGPAPGCGHSSGWPLSSDRRRAIDARTRR